MNGFKAARYRIAAALSLALALPACAAIGWLAGAKGPVTQGSPPTALFGLLSPYYPDGSKGAVTLDGRSPYCAIPGPAWCQYSRAGRVGGQCSCQGTRGRFK